MLLTWNKQILVAETKIDSGLAINCACNDQITLNQLVEQINKLLTKDIKAKYKNYRKGDIKHSFADIKLIKEKLGWIPKYSFKQGLFILTNKETKPITP